MISPKEFVNAMKEIGVDNLLAEVDNKLKEKIEYIKNGKDIPLLNIDLDGSVKIEIFIHQELSKFVRYRIHDEYKKVGWVVTSKTSGENGERPGITEFIFSAKIIEGKEL